MVQVSAPSLLIEEAYTPGLSREYVSKTYGVALDDVAKLGSAENPFGPSPKALAVVQEASARIDIYPEWTARAFREAIAAKFGFEPDRIVCGSGETEVISLIIRAFAKAGEGILMYEPCFPIYHIFAENEGRVPVYVPMGTDFDLVVDRYIDTLKKAAPKIAFITNPHSPSGKLMPEADIRRICEAAGKQTLIVLDEAYIHFTETPGSIALTRDYDNLIVLRTFSKAYGLAGLRLGFGIAQNKALIAPLLTMKPTWNLGQMQIAGGAAAMADDAHVQHTIQTIVAMRDYVTGRLKGLNRFRMVPGSRSNFFMLEITDDSLDSTQTFNALLERGVIVKDCSVSFRGLGKRYLRIDVSLKKHMDRLADALRDIDSGNQSAGKG
jgi:histidinol-phosphate aminotransferase